MTGPQQDPNAGGPAQPMPPAGAQPPMQGAPGYPAGPGTPIPPGYPAQPGTTPPGAPRPAYGPPQPGSAYQPGARPQPNFPGAFGPQGYPPPQSYPQQGYGPSPYSYPPPRQRRTGLLVGIIVAAVVLIGGGVTLLVVLLNKGGGGSAQDVADTYLKAIQSSDKSAVYDISCQANQQYMDTNAAAIDAQIGSLAGVTITMQPVKESGSSATAQFDFSANGQTGSTAITLYKNDNDTWLVCDSPLSSADQDR